MSLLRRRMMMAAKTNTEWKDGIQYELTIIENEYVDKNTGTFITYNGWSRTDYMNCDGVNMITHKGVTYSSPYNAFYDANRNFIDSFRMQASAGANDIEVPENASYFIISSTTDSIKSTVVTPHK